MYRVLKRDGKTVDFDLSKISTAITLAFDACERQYNPSIIDFIALKVTAAFEPKVKNDLVSVEDIQDSVESVLAQAGYEDVAKAYILYRRQREKLRNMKSTMLDYKKLVDSYVKATDWRVKENSTVTYSVGGLILSNSGAITANYWLSEVYDNEIAEAHTQADQILADAHAAAQREHDKLLDDAQKELKDLAVTAAKKLVFQSGGDAFDQFLNQAEREEPHA